MFVTITLATSDLTSANSFKIQVSGFWCLEVLRSVNPSLLNDKILDLTKLKAFAD